MKRTTEEKDVKTIKKYKVNGLKKLDFITPSDHNVLRTVCISESIKAATLNSGTIYNSLVDGFYFGGIQAFFVSAWIGKKYNFTTEEIKDCNANIWDRKIQKSDKYVSRAYFNESPEVPTPDSFALALIDYTYFKIGLTGLNAFRNKKTDVILKFF
jgi:hypothetical protein